MPNLLADQMPGVVDPAAARLLQPRWNRARSRLLPAIMCPMVAAVLTLLTAGTAAVLGGGGDTLLLLLPALGALLPALGLLAMSGSIVADPPGWLTALLLTGGIQLLLAGIPMLGIGFSTLPGAGAVLVTLAFLLLCGLAVLGCVLAFQARRALLVPVCAELGSTPFTVQLGMRYAVLDAALLSSSVRVGAAAVEWSARKHQGRSAGPSAGGTIGFDRLREIRPVMLGPDVPLRPWATLSDGTVLYAQPGPALLLRTDSGKCLLPVHDAGLLADLVRRRAARWFACLS